MFKRLPVERLRGSERFKHTGNKDFSVQEFWQYGFSSLNSNVLRGALAEFLVENALKENAEIEVRSPWGDYDVLYKGRKIEVKCCSYIQDWDQNKLTTIRWSGLKAKELYYSEAVAKLSDLNQFSDYKSDIYVLALFKHQDHATLDVLDVDQWCFWVLTKDKIKEISKNGGSVSFARLKKLGVEPVCFSDLPDAVTGCASPCGKETEDKPVRENGGTAIVGSVTIPERSASFSKWTGAPLVNDFGGKGVVEFDGKPMFAELAIAEMLKSEGYSVRWAETYGRGGKPPIFLDVWDERGYAHQINKPIQEEWIMNALAEIARCNNNSYSGCWDVLAWKDGKLLFVESKRKKHDKIRDTQVSWLNAAIQCGFSQENFLMVAWDFADVPCNLASNPQ